MKSLDLQWQRAQLEPELSTAMEAVLGRGDFINGLETRQFESAFAGYTGTKSCIACGNGTDSLELILEALGIGNGDEVIVPAMTFAATSEAVLRVGAIPVLVDVDRAVVLDLQAAVLALTPRTRAVIAVHLYGYPVDVELLRQLLEAAGRSDVVIIEDAAQGHGASRRGRMVGSLGLAASFSFYPGKNLGAFGDAGAVTTSDEVMSEKIRRLANHGRLGKFDHEIAGRNSRMDTLQAAVLLVKLARLDAWVARRREIAASYRAAWSGYGWLELPEVPLDGLHAWHQFAVLVPDRDALAAHLHDAGIPTGVHYPQSLPQLPFHSSWPLADFPRAVSVAAHELSLPIGEHLSDDEVSRVIDAVGSFQV
ncbi:MAG: DegT/DnrJ/EryC1/StrS family aminotransferase [Chloroflexi bacterium]|nr:DegT/DnrJ/EryC1/StrS family aminotransferase [Chloroflexota bacterium]